MTEYLDEIQARADAASHYRTGPGRCACGYDACKVGGFFPDYHAMLMNHLNRAHNRKLASRPEDVRRLVAALRAVESAARQAPPEEVLSSPEAAWVQGYNAAFTDIRDAIRDALGGAA